MLPTPYYTVNEAAQELDCTERWVYELLTLDKLTGSQPGGRLWRITPASVRRYKKQRDNLAAGTTTGDRVLAAIAAIGAAGHKATTRAIAQELETTPAAMSSALQWLKATGRVVMSDGRLDAHWLLAPVETGGQAMPVAAAGD